MSIKKDILNNYPFDISTPYQKWFEEDDVLKIMQEYADLQQSTNLAKIKELEAQVLKWISVEDQEPVPMKDILFCNVDVPDEIDTVSHGWYKSGSFYSYVSQGKIQLNATHWMQPPLKPQEK